MRKLLVLALLSLFTACGSAPAEPARTVSAAHPTAKTEAPGAANDVDPSTHAASRPASGEEPLPTAAMQQADALYRDQLATQGRDERFSTDRQIAALERAILLYQQFLERAGDDPHYAEAAKRSRDRIEDAKLTLNFLRSGNDDP